MALKRGGRGRAWFVFDSLGWEGERLHLVREGFLLDEEGITAARLFGAVNDAIVG